MKIKIFVSLCFTAMLFGVCPWVDLTVINSILVGSVLTVVGFSPILYQLLANKMNDQIKSKC